MRGTPAFVVNGKLYYGSQEWGWIERVRAAYERGQPDSAPPPPFKVPTIRVVDSARLRDAGWAVFRFTCDEAVHRPAVLEARARRAFARGAARRAG